MSDAPTSPPTNASGSTFARPVSRLLGNLGLYVRRQYEALAELFEMTLRIAKSVWRKRRRHESRLVVAHAMHQQILHSGVHALWPVMQVAVLMGIVLGLIVTVLANAELAGTLGDGLGRPFAPRMQLLFIELATTTISPLVISLIVIARSSTAIASELALMRIRGELDAYRAMGIDTDHVLVWPRIVGMVVSMICLVIFFHVLLIAAHFLIVNAFAASETVASLAQVEGASQLINLLQALLKTGLIGAGIAIISCYYGMKARQQNVAELPRAATSAAVGSIVFSVLVNVAIFIVFFQLYGFAALQG